jgi:hypothetical protein
LTFYYLWIIDERRRTKTIPMNNIVIVTDDLLQDIAKTNKEILEKLNTLTGTHAPEVLTKEEFMERAKIRLSLMNDLISKGKIKVNRYGKRLVRIPYSELLRFQRGEVK